MEEKESEINEAEELKDLIECCICAKNFNDPRLLPCSHTFCLRCLENTGEKSNKLSGNTMACPLCTKEFVIPTEGFSGLQRNFFVEKLMKMPGVVRPLSASFECDVCLEESNTDTENAGVPRAEVYCKDCEQNMCQECRKQHGRFRGTKSHEVVDVGEHMKIREFSEKPVQTLCILHGKVKLKIFCFDCQKVVCALCFVETHQAHKGADVTKVAEDFRQQIKEIILELGEKEREVDGKKSKLDQSKSELCQGMENLEKEVLQHFEELKEMCEQQVKVLLLKFKNLRQTKMKEFDVIEEDLGKHAGNLAKHKCYCNDATAFGSETDVCHDKKALSEKVTELKAQHDAIMEHEVPPFQTVFKKSSLDGFSGPERTEMIGSFLEPAPKTTAQPALTLLKAVK